MRRPAKCVTLITLVLFAACTDRDLVSDIPIINFEGAEERAFDLSEILEHPKLVQLETNEKALIDYARFAVGEKYIIAVSSNDIFQFTREGAFIRILAQRGAAPRSFRMYALFPWMIMNKNYSLIT